MLTRGRLIFISLSLLTVFMVAAGTLIAASEHQESGDGDSPYKYLAVFMEVFGLVNKAYVDEPEVGQLMSGAFEGTFDALDPFSLYVPASGLESYRESKSVGSRRSGLVVLKERGVAYVMAVEDGSPGAEAGLERGDILASLNGVDTRTTPLFDVQRVLAGEPGTKVAVERLRQGDKEVVEVELADYERPAVVLSSEKGIAVLRIPGFYEGVPASVEGSLSTIARAVAVEAPNDETAGEAGADPEDGAPAESEQAAAGETNTAPVLPAVEQPGKILIDLRGVAGGEPEVAYQIAGLFAGGELGALRQRERDLEVFTGGEQPRWTGRVAILVDRGTQGAAEILIAVLRQSTGAALIGEPTFGHSGVLEAVSITGGGQLMITSAFFTGPDREPIAEQMKPDVRVRSLPDTDESGQPMDRVLDRGVTFLLEDEEVEEEQLAA